MWRFGGKSDGGDDGYPPGGRGFDRPRGAAPRRAPTRRGPPFLPRNGGKEGQRGEFLPSGLPTLVFRTLQRVLSFFCLACGPVSYARNGPPTGWAGWGRWFRRREGKHSAKPSPRGEGGPAKPGRMRGRFGTQPFLVEKGVTDSRPDRLLLLPRWATRSPPHPSPSVTASPQGEAFVGGTPPQRNAFSPKPCFRKKRIQIRVRRWEPKQPIHRPAAPPNAKTSE